ncbi:hypothetical protein LINPERHAP2_LOCUS41390, partial [Linum perenne]
RDFCRSFRRDWSFLLQGRSCENHAPPARPGPNPALRPLVFSISESVSSAARIEEHGFEHTTISDVLLAKDDSAQCWSIGGGETWRAEVERRNHQ